MIKTLIDGGINWNWYLQADFNEVEKTAHIYFYDRWHKYEYRGSNHPVYDAGHIQILEDDKRIVYGLKLDGIEYLVTNPAYVFNYRDMTHFVAEK